MNTSMEKAVKTAEDQMKVEEKNGEVLEIEGTTSDDSLSTLDVSVSPSLASSNDSLVVSTEDQGSSDAEEAPPNTKESSSDSDESPVKRKRIKVISTSDDDGTEGQSCSNKNTRGMNQEIIAILIKKLEVHIEVISMLEQQMMTLIMTPPEYVKLTMMDQLQSLSDRISEEIRLHEQDLALLNYHRGLIN